MENLKLIIGCAFLFNYVSSIYMKNDTYQDGVTTDSLRVYKHMPNESQAMNATVDYDRKWDNSRDQQVAVSLVFKFTVLDLVLRNLDLLSGSE